MKKENCYKKILLYIKISETTYYWRNKETILNRAKNYYKNNKEVLRERAKNKCRKLSEKEKNIKTEHGKNRYMSEEKKLKLKEYQKNIGKLKSLNLLINIFYRFNNVCYALVMH